MIDKLVLIMQVGRFARYHHLNLMDYQELMKEKMEELIWQVLFHINQEDKLVIVIVHIEEGMNWFLVLKDIQVVHLH